MRRMRNATRSRAAARLIAGLAAGLALATTAVTAQQDEAWVSVAKGERTEIFVETASLQWSGPWLAVRTRQEFAEPQASAKKGKTFLSARNDYRIDCPQRRLAYREMHAYAEAELQGDVVQKTKIGEKNLKWMDAQEGTVFGELLDYACSHAPSAPPVAAVAAGAAGSAGRHAPPTEL